VLKTCELLGLGLSLGKLTEWEKPFYFSPEYSNWKILKHFYKMAKKGIERGRGKLQSQSKKRQNKRVSWGRSQWHL
jgi:hypothetical protein